jgi:diadenosine tetraphosphate (Ap4A) HIT family hydrolase
MTLTYSETCNLCPWHSEAGHDRIALKCAYHTVFFPAVPMVYREDGGHLILLPNRHVTDIQYFTREESLEYISLCQSVSRVMYDLLPKFGIDLGRINYHDNGNLEADKKIGAHQHLHFFGRSRDAKRQVWKSNLYFPTFDPANEYYKNSTHFSPEEKRAICESLPNLFHTYRNEFK